MTAVAYGGSCFAGTPQYAPPALPPALAAKFHEARRLLPPVPPPDIPLQVPDGTPVSLAGFTGRWHLVNFWASWCPGCLWEIPFLLELKTEFQEAGLAVVFVSLDYAPSDAWMTNLRARAGVPAAVDGFYVNDYNLRARLDFPGIPSTMVIGPDGLVYYILAGEVDWMAPDMRDFIAGLLKMPMGGGADK